MATKGLTGDLGKLHSRLVDTTLKRKYKLTKKVVHDKEVDDAKEKMQKRWPVIMNVWGDDSDVEIDTD